MSVVLPGSLAAGGLKDALRAMGKTLNEMARVRGALFAVELREEVEKRKRMLLLAALGAALLHTAFLLLTAFVALLFWDTHRIAAVGAMAALYLACGIVALIRLRANAASADPFAGTLGELRRDLAALDPQT
jgi:uncharacterized membrane protein YqjE